MHRALAIPTKQNSTVNRVFLSQFKIDFSDQIQRLDLFPRLIYTHRGYVTPFVAYFYVGKMLLKMFF